VYQRTFFITYCVRGDKITFSVKDNYIVYIGQFVYYLLAALLRIRIFIIHAINSFNNDLLFNKCFVLIASFLQQTTVSIY
jgi:hypothetical protein